MTDDRTAREAREPIAFTCDASTLRTLSVAGTVVALVSPGSWPLLLVVVAAGTAMGLAEHSWVAGVFMAALAIVGLALVVYSTNRKQFRGAVRPGAVMTSGYDDHPRLVISGSAGSTGLDAGSVRKVSRRGAVTILTLSRRSARLVTPSPLVTPADAAFLQGSAPAPERVVLTPSGPGPMPFAHVVTPEDQRNLRRTLNSTWLRRRAFWLILSMEVLVVVAGIAVDSPVLALFGVGLVAVVAMNPLFVRRNVRQVFPAGREIRAGLTPDALLLDTTVSTERVPYTEVEDVRVESHTLLLTLPMKRRIALPRALLPDEAVAQLTAAVAGRPSPRWTASD